MPTPLRICRRCGQEKSLEDFPPNRECAEGRRRTCRPCENVRRKPVRLRRYAERSLDDRQASVRRQYAKNREARIVSAREWRASNPDRVAATNLSNYTRNRERMFARKAVEYAVSQGQLVRPETCEWCGVSGRVIDGHHPSYAREDRLKVNWICRSCHRRHHAAERAAQRVSA